MNSPIKWHGGKHYLAHKIVALMPKHVHYVEPFAGSLAVLLAKDANGVSEVVNDRNGELTHFWRVLQDPTYAHEFIRRAGVTPFSEVEWRAAAGTAYGPIDRALKFFIRCRQSLAGRMDAFAPLSRNRTRRGMNEQAAAWLSAVEGLPQVHTRLQRVVVMDRPAVEVIRQQDGPGTLFYCDPPYPHGTRTDTDTYGPHEMTVPDHHELLRCLSGVQGKFLLSSYRNDIYDEYARHHGWTRYDFELPNNAASGPAKRRMTECLWCNF